MTKVQSTILVVLASVSLINAQTCPDGYPIYKWGISEQGKVDVVYAHNYYRNLLASGQVPGQPKGKNFKSMIFDQNLSNEGRKVSQTCQMNHIIASDGRWNWVGQNLFIQWSSGYSENQDWYGAVGGWFNEYKNYNYPIGPKNENDAVGHYTQVAWANSYALGCDFVLFYDKSQPSYPYAKLYTCNYGPGGNIGGQAPYERA